MTIKNKKFGFTLAEALMALLVISLITIASIPVITKKKRLVETARESLQKGLDRERTAQGGCTALWQISLRCSSYGRLRKS